MKYIKYILFTLLFYGLLFENALETISPQLGNIDEIFSVILVLVGIYKLIKYKNGKLLKDNRLVLVFISLIIAIGIASNIIYKYQLPKFAIKDILTFRSIIVYAMVPVVFYGVKLDSYKKILNINLQITSVVLAIGCIVNMIVGYFPVFEYRFGIPSQQLFFTHPTYLASAASIVLVLLSALMKDFKNKIYIAMSMIVILATLRFKAISFVLVYLVLYYLVIVKNKKLQTKELIIIGALALLLSSSQIIEYFTHPYWSRSAMTIASFFVAKDHFPLGGGFGTYGSWNSGVSYSPLYKNYNIEMISGIEWWDYKYIADTFWPMILGQFGFIGLILFIAIVVVIFININKNKNINYYFAQMALFVYILILSLGEPSFTGPYGVVFLLLLGLLNKNNDVEGEIE